MVFIYFILYIVNLILLFIFWLFVFQDSVKSILYIIIKFGCILQGSVRITYIVYYKLALKLYFYIAITIYKVA